MLNAEEVGQLLAESWEMAEKESGKSLERIKEGDTYVRELYTYLVRRKLY